MEDFIAYPILETRIKLINKEKGEGKIWSYRECGSHGEGEPVTNQRYQIVIHSLSDFSLQTCLIHPNNNIHSLLPLKTLIISPFLAFTSYLERVNTMLNTIIWQQRESGELSSTPFLSLTRLSDEVAVVGVWCRAALL